MLGIRPEDMEDASLVSDAPSDRRIEVEVELREALGSDVLVHFRIAAPPAMTDDAKELASDVGIEALERVEAQAQGGDVRDRRPAQPAHPRRPRATRSSWWSTPTGCTSSTRLTGPGSTH